MERDNIRRCEKCGMALKEKNFYRSKDIEAHPPDGYINICKQCFTMHLNIEKHSTLIPLLKQLDMPYVPNEWNRLVNAYAEDIKSKRTTKTALFGRYIGKMRLAQFVEKRFKDSVDFIDDEAFKDSKGDSENLEAMFQLDEIKNLPEEELKLITKDVDLATLSETELKELYAAHTKGSSAPKQADTLYAQKTAEKEALQKDLYAGLTQEDKDYLLLKWGQTYSLEESLQMEKFYLDMMEGYDIRSPSHIDYLMKICKCSMKMDQCLDSNDLDGFNKISKIYDMLMKAAKFQPIQTQEIHEDGTKVLNQFVALCEKYGFVPRFVTDEPKDVVDYTIKDLQNYTKKLVTNENNLENSLEIYLEKMVREENKEEDKDTGNDEMDWSIPEEIAKTDSLTDEDLIDFNDFIEKEREIDLEALEEDAEI